MILPSVRAQGPAVAEDHRLAGAPIFEIKLRSVLSGNGVHWMFGLRVSWRLLLRFGLCAPRTIGRLAAATAPLPCIKNLHLDIANSFLVFIFRNVCFVFDFRFRRFVSRFRLFFKPFVRHSASRGRTQATSVGPNLETNLYSAVVANAVHLVFFSCLFG